MTIDARLPMRSGTRRECINGYVAGFRASHTWSEACKLGWMFRGGWLDGKAHRGCLTPLGARRWLTDTGWFGFRYLDRD